MTVLRELVIEVERGSIVVIFNILLGLWLVFVIRFWLSIDVCLSGVLVFCLGEYLAPYRQKVTVLTYEGEGYMKVQYHAHPFLIRETIYIEGYDKHSDRDDIDSFIVSALIGRTVICRIRKWHNKRLARPALLARLRIDGRDMFDLIESKREHDDKSSAPNEASGERHLDASWSS